MSDSNTFVLSDGMIGDSLTDRFGKNSKIDFLYEEKAGLIGQFAEDSDLEFDLDNFKNIGNYDLVIIRHYLEHFKDPMAILDELSKVTSKKGFLYIEVPDTEQFVQKGNPLFLWEQHRFYFNKKSLLNLLFQGGYNIIFSSCIQYILAPLSSLSLSLFLSWHVSYIISTHT